MKLVTLEEKPREYIEHMITCCLSPEDSEVAPKFSDMVAALTVTDVSALKRKLTKAISKNKGNDARTTIYQEWRKAIKEERPEVLTSIGGSQMDDAVSRFPHTEMAEELAQEEYHGELGQPGEGTFGASALELTSPCTGSHRQQPTKGPCTGSHRLLPPASCGVFQGTLPL